MKALRIIKSLQKMLSWQLLWAECNLLSLKAVKMFFWN